MSSTRSRRRFLARTAGLAGLAWLGATPAGATSRGHAEGRAFYGMTDDLRGLLAAPEVVLRDCLLQGFEGVAFRADQRLEIVRCTFLYGGDGTCLDLGAGPAGRISRCRVVRTGPGPGRLTTRTPARGIPG